MPFEILETFTKANMPPKAKLSYMPSTGRGKNGGKKRDDAKPQLVVSIPTVVCGTAKAKQFQIRLGTGAEKGKLRIVGTKTGGVSPAELIHAFVFRFGYVPRFGDEHFDGERRDVRKISDDEFEIDIPADWFA